MTSEICKRFIFMNLKVIHIDKFFVADRIIIECQKNLNKNYFI
jgi:hypothetical protein